MSSGQDIKKDGKETVKPVAARNKTLPAGKYPLKNLKFLGDFMTTLRLTTTTAAEKAGLTQVTVYYWLKKDDAHLSSVENLINAWGYRLSFELVSPDDEISIVNIELPNEKRLAFLERAMVGVDRMELQKKLGIGTTTIYYWLTHDDIFISYIFQIAEALGKKVKINIRPM